MSYGEFVLPPSIVSKIDVSRLVSEVEAIDNELTTAAVRTKAGAAQQARPPLSSELSEFLSQNQLKASNGTERAELVKQLRLLKDTVPVVHMTFAATADQQSLQQLVAWLRASVHPQAVIAVGLQPSLIAGVYVRTPNHVHDLSLRAKVKNSRGVLVSALEGLRGGR